MDWAREQTAVGGVLQPAINSLLTRSVDKSEVGGMLGVSAAFLIAAGQQAH